MRKTRLISIRVTMALVTCSVLAGQLARSERPFIVLQATTSTASSGLIDYLLPKFADFSDVQVRAVISGSGQALTNARRGDADVVLSHSEAAEKAFVAEGFGVSRIPVMYNKFVLVGPPEDPAGIGGMKDASAAIARIAALPSRFISRGDSSGTHIRELSLWRDAKIDPVVDSGSWYLEVGAGQRTTLNITIEMNAYTLTDWATWTRFDRKSGYRVMVKEDSRLLNQYSVMLVNFRNNLHVKKNEGQIFIDWLIGPAGQKSISEFRINGNQAFFPNR